MTAKTTSPRRRRWRTCSAQQEKCLRRERGGCSCGLSSTLPRPVSSAYLTTTIVMSREQRRPERASPPAPTEIQSKPRSPHRDTEQAPPPPRAAGPPTPLTSLASLESDPVLPMPAVAGRGQPTLGPFVGQGAAYDTRPLSGKGQPSVVARPHPSPAPRSACPCASRRLPPLRRLSRVPHRLTATRPHTCPAP